MTIRCKFHCITVTKRESAVYDPVAKMNRPVFVYDAKMQAVYQGSPENLAFFASTPSGTFEVTTMKDDNFTPGRDYYLDISAADPVA